MSKAKVPWLLCIGRLVCKTDNVRHFAHLVKQAGVDLVSDLFVWRDPCSSSPTGVQGLFVLFARVGSGEPVRVLRLLHNKYAGYNWSIYCWDICTTCRYRDYVLRYCRVCTSWVLTGNDSVKDSSHGTVRCLIYTCVCVSRTVFRDRFRCGIVVSTYGC